MKQVAHLDVDLARIGVVRAAESLAIVQQKAAVGKVQAVDGNGKILADRLSEREIESGVGLEMAGHVSAAVGEAGAVVEAARGPGTPRQVGFEVCVQSVALIVIQEEVAVVRRREIGEPSRDCAFAFGMLIRVGDGNVSARCIRRGERIVNSWP